MIDIILCTYNSERTIAECIESILKQTLPDFNLYIYDDCSQDSTVSIVKKYTDNRIVLVRADKHYGTYVGKNLVFSNFCRSDFIAMHDSDDISDPLRLSGEMEFLRLHEYAAAVGCAIREFWDDFDIKPHTDCNNDIANKQRINTYPFLLNVNTLKQIVPLLKEDEGYNKYLKHKLCMNGSVIFRKKAIEDVGGWDGTTLVGADGDIFMRLLAKYNIYNLPDVLYARRFHKDSLTASPSVGIGSITRKQYNLSRLPIIEKAANGIVVKENFYVPPDLGFQIG